MLCLIGYAKYFGNGKLPGDFKAGKGIIKSVFSISRVYGEKIGRGSSRSITVFFSSFLLFFLLTCQRILALLKKNIYFLWFCPYMVYHYWKFISFDPSFSAINNWWPLFHNFWHFPMKCLIDYPAPALLTTHHTIVGSWSLSGLTVINFTQAAEPSPKFSLGSRVSSRVKFSPWRTRSKSLNLISANYSHCKGM